MPVDCSKLREAVDKAAGVAGTLWLSYIFLLFYVLLAIVGVTHVNQFLEDSVELPFLQIKLPMLGFFWVGPFIVVLAHAYVLHHITLMADIARELNQCDPAPTDLDRALLDISLFAQMLAGPSKQQNPSSWWVEQVIVWVTLVAAPVLTLMYFELQFLPSHNQTTTWWARICMLGDLGLLWWMWPRAFCRTKPVRNPSKAPGWKDFRLRPWGLSFMILLTAGTSYVAIFLATFPGEWLDRNFWTFPLHETLVVGRRETDGDKLLIQPIWPNRLFVRGVDVVDRSKYDSPAKLAMAAPTRSMRDRHLEYAVVIEAQLTRADFTGAHLQGASLVRAHAMGTWFDHADLSGAQLDYADLEGASFFAARLAGATMDSAQLQGARLAGANLRAAWMPSVRLDGASLAGADLRRATLNKSVLRGANLKEARLQGASLVDTKLEAASFDGAYLWRVDFRRADAGKGLRHRNTDPDPEPRRCDGPPADACTTTDTLDSLRELIRLNIPNTGPPGSNGTDKDSRAAMFDQLMPLAPDETEGWVAKSQEQLKNFTLLNDQYTRDLWQDIACVSKGAPYIISMLIDTYEELDGWTRPTSQEATQDMVDFLISAKCPASLAIPSDVMRMQLRDLPRLRLPGRPAMP